MSMSERVDPKAGPFCNLSQTYFAGLDWAAKAYEPVLKNVARWQLELMGLGTRRARAWLELPVQVVRCKSPQELAQLNLEYWQTAGQQYAESAQRLAVLGGQIAMPRLNGEWAKAAAPGRDYITFAEPKPAAEEELRRDRRAA